MATTMPHDWAVSCIEGTSVHQQIAASLNISQTEIEDVYQCTPLQEALITLSTVGSAAYVKRIVLSLRSDIDLPKFRSAVQDVVWATSILRTRIVQCTDVGFVQVVLNKSIQWSSENGTLEEFLEKGQTEIWGVGDPLLRYSLITDSQAKARWFVWTIHHAIYDGWSFPIMAGNVSKRYNDEPIEPTIQYKDFVQHILQSDSDQHGAYWHSSLADNSYTQFPLLPNQSYMPNVGSTFEQHCRPWQKVQGITRTTMLHAAWAIILRQFHNIEDAIFGTILSGRNEPIPGLRDLIGPTVATVPVRVKFDIGDTVQEYLEKLQNDGEARKSFGQYGLHAISKLSGDAKRACSFQTLFVVQPGEESHAVRNGVGAWQRVEADIGRSSYALTIQCFLNRRGTRVLAAFDSSVAEAWRVQKLIQQLCFVVEQLSQSDRSQLVSDFIAVVPADDLQKIWKWNAAVPAPAETCIHDIVSANARQQPLAPAICAWDGELTYAQLDSLSTQLAGRLVSLGVRQEVLVPLCFEKSMWMAVAMLGVMKAGGAFVPLDVSQAADRARLILEEIEPTVVVVSQKNQHLVHQLGYHTLVPDGSGLASLCKQHHAYSTNARLHSAAYVVFTSGSTGKPKGVIVEHQAASTSLLAHGAKLGLSRTSRFLQFASHSFDASIMEILTTLVYCGCVCVPSDTSRLQDLTENIHRMGVNTLFLTPSVARILQPDQLPSLKTLAIGGEIVSSTDTRRWKNLPRLLEVYGPTECTILSVMQLLVGDVPPQTIGQAVGSVTWVVDPDNHESLVPVGAVGELMIEGHILARGYLKDPARTQASFVDDPSWLLRGSHEQPGRRGRLYRTGDLVRYNIDGTLVYLGRKDTQVKIRGQRVELGEVEHQIQRLLNTSKMEYSAAKQEEASVSEILVAAEVITPQGSRQPTLVGFVYPGKSAFNVGDSQSQKRCAAAVQNMVAGLGERLASVLPSHMVPSAYIPLEYMPMMTTGKTDRRRLREIACSFTRLDLASLSMPSTRSKRLPETDAERTLQQIWARTLNLSRDFGIDESFFSLGGDSISAMQVSAAARWYGLLFSANDMILNNTVSKLSHTLQTPKLERGDSPAAREAGPNNSGSDFCLSPIQQFHFQTRSPGPDLMDVPFYIRFTKSVPTQIIKDTLHAVVERHPMLRARFHHDVTGSWSQYICQKAEDSLLFHHFIQSSESQKIEAITGCREKIDIEHGPSFVAILFTDLDQQTLFLSAHHLVIDFVSWRVIFQDMEDFITLQGFGLSTSSSYQEWCNFQTDYASTHLVPDSALHYEPDYSDITYWGLADEPGPETYTHRRFSLNKSISTALLTFKSETVQFRPHELLMAALGFSFRQTFPDRNLPPIFTEGHGRDAWTESFDLSQTVGWFTTMFPVQVAPEEGEDFFDYILQTKECLQNIPRRGWSYFASKFLNKKGRQVFQNDPIEINFNFLGHFQQLERESSLMEAISLPAGCKLEAMGPMKTVGLFDVTIIIERGEIEADFKYNTRAKHQDKIEAWIAAYKTVLLEFVSSVNDIRPS